MRKKHDVKTFMNLSEEKLFALSKKIKHTLLEILNVLRSCFNIANVILYMCCPIISMQFIF